VLGFGVELLDRNVVDLDVTAAVGSRVSFLPNILVPDLNLCQDSQEKEEQLEKIDHYYFYFTKQIIGHLTP
jgi:hypothetical protein